MRPEEIVELVGNIANRSDIREAQSKQVQAIYDLLAVRERETLERAARVAELEGVNSPNEAYEGACENVASLIRDVSIQIGGKDGKSTHGPSDSRSVHVDASRPTDFGQDSNSGVALTPKECVHGKKLSECPNHKYFESQAQTVDDVRNYALENAAELVQGWHASKGGYTELAYHIRALKSSPVERGDVSR